MSDKFSSVKSSNNSKSIGTAVSAVFVVVDVGVAVDCDSLAVVVVAIVVVVVVVDSLVVTGDVVTVALVVDGFVCSIGFFVVVCAVESMELDIVPDAAVDVSVVPNGNGN